MPSDPSIVDAAARAAEALAEFGRKVAVLSDVGPAPDAVVAELRRIGDAWSRRMTEVMDELGSLRRAVERLAGQQGLVDPIAQINRQAQAEIASGHASAGGAQLAVSDNGSARVMTAERAVEARRLWALPMAQLSVRGIADALSMLPGPPVSTQAVHRWAYDAGLPYRDPSHRLFGKPRPVKPHRRRGVQPDDVAAVAPDVAPVSSAHPGASAAQPAPEVPPPPAMTRDDPRNWPRPPDRIVAPGQEAAPVVDSVLADDATIRAWAGARGIVFQGQVDLARINRARQTHNLPPFRLVDARGRAA